MIKTLRRKFITISMCSIAAVLFLMIGGINLSNYLNVNRVTDIRLNMLAENQGRIPQKRKPSDESSHKLWAEAPFDTRFFTVVLKEDGTVLSIDTSRIAAVSTEDAAAYAVHLWQTRRTDGYYGDYKYHTLSLSGTTGECNIMYIFLDCQRELSTFRDFLAASVAASLLGMFLVFLLVVFFSRLLLRPIAESYDKQKRFITDASHELKTPLTIIDANTEVLEMETGGNEWTASIHNQVKRLTDLTQNLVLLSRMDESISAGLVKLDFSLSDAVEGAARPFEAVAAATHKQLVLHITPGLFYYGDEASIRQLAGLLLDNAIKYSAEESSILLSLSKSGKNKVLTVQNTARELPDGRLDLLFERFYRPDASRSSATGGYGLGLSVAKAIAAAHKGKISVTGKDGNIIIFTVIL